MSNLDISELQLRQGEKGEQHQVRSSRYFKNGDYWYYSTREGVDIGPFDHMEAAEVGCAEFIDFVCHRNPVFSKTLQYYQRLAS